MDNKTIKVLCLIAVLLIIGSSLLAFKITFSNKNMQDVTINEIKTNPANYDGKMVTIKGEYRGWQAEDGQGPPITRSDWVIRDGTGWIYVTGEYPKLDPYEDIGHKVIVMGVVRIKNSKAYIEADDVKT